MGWDLVAGKRRVPEPATAMTAFLISKLRKFNQVRTKYIHNLLYEDPRDIDAFLKSQRAFNDALNDELANKILSQQNELLAALAESIVPGSTRAHVSRFVDLLLSVDKRENQRRFVESLTALDAEAQKRFKKSFPALGEEQKNAFLTEASTGSERPQAHPRRSDALSAHRLRPERNHSPNVPDRRRDRNPWRLAHNVNGDFRR